MRPAKRMLVRTGFALVIMLFATACGGGAGGDGDSTEPASQPTGDATVGQGESEAGDANCEIADAPNDGVTSDEIKVGFLGDISGPTASTQSPVRDGVQAYVDYINEQGGVLGRELTLVTHDDAYVVDQTLLGYRSLVSDENVLALVGFGNSGGIEALNAEIEQTKVPIIGSQSALNTTHENEYFWNVVANERDTVKVVNGRMATEFLDGPESVKAIAVALTAASGDNWVTAVEEVVTEGGGTVVGTVRVDVAAEDMSAEARQIAQLVEEGGNAIYLHGTIRPFIVLFDGLEAAGVTETPIGGMSGMVQPEVFAQAPEEVTDDAWGVATITPPDVDEPGNVEMQEYLESAGIDDHDSISFTLGWVNGKILTEAISRSAENCELTRASLQEALSTISDFDTGGQSPVIDFTRPGHNGGAVGRPYEWDGEQLQPVGDYDDYAEFIDG